MCMTDWSSDVCSSDLLSVQSHTQKRQTTTLERCPLLTQHVKNEKVHQLDARKRDRDKLDVYLANIEYSVPKVPKICYYRSRGRSEEAREGKGCGSTCSSRRSRDHKQKKKRTKK